MKNFVKYLIVVLLQLLLPLLACAQEAGEDSEDDGTDADGKVILSETLVNRCGLKGSSDPEIPESCFNKLASDVKLGKTPDGENYETEARKILKEQTTGYMEIAINRLINASEHEDKIDKITEKAGDSRDDVEQIIKLSTDIGSTTADVVDTTSSINKLLNAELLYFDTIPTIASFMTEEEANNEDLRKTKTSL